MPRLKEMGAVNAALGYPIRVQAELEQPSRWLWLVKWLLVIPHYIVLAVLWTAFVLLSIVAFFGILITGHYPALIFEFNAGVLRWTWRVSYYAYGALGTDRYPPFTLKDVPDYPARLEIAYPEHLSRGLVLVKWWLLAIPHYIIVGLLVGGVWVAGRTGWPAGGLIGILVLVAAVTLAFTGRYPQQLFDLILGLNRWVMRVALYAGLMTDAYPPFRLDTGGHEPGTLTASAPPTTPPPASGATRVGWTGGRITSLVIGSLLALTSLGLLAGGGVGLWAHTALRDSAGFVTADREGFATATYALTSDAIDLQIGGATLAGSMLGDARLRATPANQSTALFIGIARTEDVDRYLGNVERTIVSDLKGHSTTRTAQGTKPTGPPASQGFWIASSVGPGAQTIRWPMQSGTWTIVAMNSTAARGLNITADIGATFPALVWIASGLLAGGAVFLAISLVLMTVPIRRAGRTITNEGRAP